MPTFQRRRGAPQQLLFDVDRPADWTPTAEVTPGPLNPEQWLNWLKRKWNAGMQAGAADPMAGAVGMVNPFASGVKAGLGRILPPAANRTQVVRRRWNPEFTPETNVLPPAAVANRSLVIQPGRGVPQGVRRRWQEGDPSLYAAHGTPFPAFPAFNLANVGHGQGAASQGAGMYMGEAAREATARSYQTMHATDPIHVVRSAMYQTEGDTTRARALILEALTHATGATSGPSTRTGGLVPYGTPGLESSFWREPRDKSLQDPEQLQKALELLDTGADVRGIAKVQINILPEQLVDLDRILTAQSPQVQQALGELLSRLGFSHDRLKQSFLEAETAIRKKMMSQLRVVNGTIYTYPSNSKINPLQWLPDDPALWQDPKLRPSRLPFQTRFISGEGQPTAGATYGWQGPAQNPDPLTQMTAELDKLAEAQRARRTELERAHQSGEIFEIVYEDPLYRSLAQEAAKLDVALRKAIWDHVAAAYETAPAGRFTLNPAATAYTMGKGLTGQFGPKRDYPLRGGSRGTEIFRRPRQASGGEVSQALQASGVPGNRYFDAFSRPGHEGTRNYVIWDVTQAKILRWVLGAIGAVGAGESMNQQRRVPSARVY